MPFSQAYPARRREVENPLPSIKFFDEDWSSWQPVAGTPSRGAGKDGLVPGTPGYDPIFALDDEEEREGFNKLRRWGQGPVFAAIEELDLDEVNSVESLDAINGWLVENYGDLFKDGDEEEEEEREPFVPTPYERKELDMGDFEAPEELKIRKSGIKVSNSPMKIKKTPIKGMSYGT